MAFIEERINGRGKKTYRVRVRLKGHPAVSATFDRKTDANEWAKQTEVSIKDGRYFKTVEAKKHTLGELIARYKKEVLNHLPKSKDSRIRHLDWWNKEIGHLLLGNISTATIKECQTKLKNEEVPGGKPRNNATVNRYMATLSAAFTIAVNEWEWLEDSPTRKIKRLTESRGRVRYLSDEERERLLIACKASNNAMLYPAVILALSTGMRHAEVMNLRWSDIDFKRDKIYIHETKNNERRSVPLQGHAKNTIKDYSRVRRLDTDLLFPSKVNSQKPINLRKPWEAALKKAKINDFRFHDLRHSTASYLAMNGASSVQIAAILGHKTLSMVKRYSHLSEQNLADVVSSMNKSILR